jgi:hypothetical protein
MKQLLDEHHILAEGAGWFEVKGFAIRIHATDEGVIVDIYSKEKAETIASTYAFDHELMGN